MVILTNEGAVGEYSNVRQRWSADRIPVQCIVSGDVDGLCALRVLMQILRNDKIHPVVSPVNSPTDVLKALSETPTDAGAVTVFLLNCGGAMNLEEYMPKGDVQIHLVDPHRPHHLSNVTSSHIKVWQDGDIARHIRRCQQRKRKRKQKVVAKKRRKAERKTDGSDRSWDPNDEAENSNSDDDTLDSDGNAVPRKSRGGGGGGDTAENGGLEVVPDTDDENDDDSETTLSDSLSDPEGEDEEEDGQARMKLLEEQYYRGTWYGTPSCMLLQNLAAQVMSAPPDDLLWLASVSVTHFYITAKMSLSDYTTHMSDFSLKVAHSNLTKPKTELVGEDRHEYTAFHSIRLDATEEYQLFLLRHLSLWDSMVLSSFVTSKLQLLNTEDGLNSLRKLVHGTLGLKDEECRSEWITLANSNRREDILHSLGDYFTRKGLASFTFPGIVMRQGYGEGVSAADMCHIVQALLTEPTNQVVLVDKEKQEKNDKPWIDAFYGAFDALDYMKTAGVLKGVVEKARQAQTAMMRQCAALLQKEYVRNLQGFRYSFINEASTDLPFFVHPLSLASLARCVFDTLSEASHTPGTRGGDPESKLPLILLALDRDYDMYTVVPCVAATGDIQEDSRSPFGNTLRAAMEGVVVTVSGASGEEKKVSTEKEIGFDYTTCMKVHKRDMRAVLDTLAWTIIQQST